MTGIIDLFHGINYDAARQEGFRRGLRKGDSEDLGEALVGLREARQWLEKLPYPSVHDSGVGRMQRNVVLAVGHRELSSRLLTLLRKVAEGKVQQTDLANKFAELAAYQRLGTLAEISERLNRLAEYEGLGGPRDVARQFEELAEHRKLGTPAGVSGGLEQLAEYQRLGTPADLAEQLETLKKYKELGEVDDLEDASDNLAEYQKLGTHEEVSKKLGRLEEYEELGELEVLTEREKEVDKLEKELGKFNSIPSV
jgi:hypothetical protein